MLQTLFNIAYHTDSLAISMQRLSLIKAVQDYKASRLVDLIQLRLYAYALPRMIKKSSSSLPKAQDQTFYNYQPTLEDFLQTFTFITDGSGKSVKGHPFIERVGISTDFATDIGLTRQHYYYPQLHFERKRCSIVSLTITRPLSSLISLSPCAQKTFSVPLLLH